MKTRDSTIRFLGLGLKRSRTTRILEEFESDSGFDPKAKRTAITRTLKSYFWVANLSGPIVFIIGAIGLILTFKFHWYWASCLLLVSLFTTQSNLEQTLASRAFKVYKLFVGSLLLLVCYFALRFENSGDWGRVNNLDFYLGNTVYVVGGAIASVALIAIFVELLKSKGRVVQLQRLLFILCTIGIYWSSNYNAPWPYGQSYLIQASLTGILFAAALIKRKPALA